MGKGIFQLMNLDRHIRKWQDCTKCPIGGLARHHVFFRGKVPCDILFIGEAPGKSEDKDGRPFVGVSGNLLDEWLVKAGLTSFQSSRLTYAITNTVSCRPCDRKGGNNRPPHQLELDNCSGRLLSFVDLCNPEALVYLGKVAERHCLELGFPQVALCLHHPSFVLRRGGSSSRESKDCVTRLRAFVETISV